MDGSNNLISTNNPSLSTQHHYQQHLPSSSMPFSSYYLSSTRVVSDRRNGGGEEDLGSGAHGFTGIASAGIDPAGFFDARAKSVELDLDAHGSESEEGVGFSDGPAKRTPPRGGSGSKRSRAAEVHNLSEKRRRSRINEKMKALQNLIPNSNKTDKASMLDEAIDYLKQLQLQVQMLSMRNGLNLHPIYMPGVLQPLQSTQLNMGFAVENGSAMNMGLEMLPLNLDSSARNSYGLSDRCTSSHPPLILPNVPSMPTTGTSFGMESSQSHHRSLQLPVAPEIFTQDMVSEEQLDPGRSTRKLQENEIKSMAVAASLHFGGQASSLEDTEHLEGGVLGRKRSEDMRSEDQDNQIFIQHLNGLRTGSGFASGDIKPEF